MNDSSFAILHVYKKALIFILLKYKGGGEKMDLLPFRPLSIMAQVKA